MAERITVSFTAARDLGEGGQEVLLNVLITAVPLADRYATGAAIGGDTFIGRWLRLNRPDAEHVVVIPADRSRVDPWWLELGGVTVIMMPAGSTYADRNAKLVELGTMVFGFPGYPEDDPQSARSGTWQTIRMARKAGNMSQWHCVKPPYKGLIEAHPSELAHA